MAKKIQAFVKLQCPAGAANPAPPVGTALGPQGINIMAFCKEFNARTQGQADGDPGRGHDLRRQDVHLHHQDAAGAEPPAEEGAGSRRERPAEPEQGRQGHPGAGQEDRRDQDGRPQRDPTSTAPWRWSPARRARWGWRWWTDGDPRQEVQGRGRQGRPRRASIRSRQARRAGEGLGVRQVRRDGGRRRAPRRRPAPRRSGRARHGRAAPRNRQAGSRARHRPGRQGAGGGGRRRRLRRHRVHPEDQGRLARVRRPRRHAGRHGPARRSWAGCSVPAA